MSVDNSSSPIRWSDVTSWNSVGWYVALFIGIWGALMGVGAYWPAHGFFAVAMVLACVKWAHATHIHTSDRKIVPFAIGLVLAFAVIWVTTLWTSKKVEESAKEKKDLEQLNRIPKLQSQVQELQTQNSDANLKLAAKEDTIEGLTKVVIRQSQELATNQHKDTTQVVGNVTGGDTFCYAVLWSNDVDPTKPPSGSYRIGLLIVGDFPLRGISVRVTDVQRTKAIVSDKTLTGEQSAHALLANDISFNVTQTLVPDHVAIIGPVFLGIGDEHDLNIFFQSLNGDWSEEFRCKKINGEWVQAIRVLRQQKSGEKPRYWTKIDKDFPRNSHGEVDWN